MKILTYNPHRDSAQLLKRLTCGKDRLAVLDQLVLSLRSEINQKNHQHHLIIGPRGSGKTHLLRILTGLSIPDDPDLSNAYFPIVMAEETPLRSPADLFLKILERLADKLKEGPPDDMVEKYRNALPLCLSATSRAKAIRKPLERLDIAAEALSNAAKALDRILVPVVENLDLLLYLGARGRRKGRIDEHWALRRNLQNTKHMILIAAAPTMFGAVGDPNAPFFDFFRAHRLKELKNDEVLDIIERRLNEEVHHPGADRERNARIARLNTRFSKKRPKLRGLLAITGGLPRYAHQMYDVIVETDVRRVIDTLNGFLDEMTPYFQQRLDPRLIPESELDLLHTLAMARGPLQPTELSEKMYGVPTNEVAELLGRLNERALVEKQRGRPGGKAVTWDITEPLYRVWTRFRFIPSEQALYVLLAEIVALLFSLDEIVAERRSLSLEVEKGYGDDALNNALLSRKRLMDAAYEHSGREFMQEKIIALGKLDFKDSGLVDKSIESLRSLAENHPDNIEIQKQFAIGLFITLNRASKENDLSRRDSLLEEIRALTEKYPDDPAVREQLARGLFNTMIDAKEEDDLSRRDSLLDEIRALSEKYPDDPAVREQLARGLFNTMIDAKEENELSRRDSLLEEIRALTEKYPDDPAVNEAMKKGLLIFGISIIQQARMKKDYAQAKSVLAEVEKTSSSDILELLRLIRLSLASIEIGLDKAMAREPEEIRRTVRLFLEKAEG